MKKILITTLLIVGVTSIIAQTNSIEQSIKELQLKIEQSQKEEKLKWLDSLSKITKFKTELQYDSIVRKTIALAIELKAIDIELYHTSNLIEYQNYTLDKPKVGIQTFLNFNLKNESITNANLLAKLYLNGSNSYYEEKNYPKSIEYINKTLSIFENLNNNLEKSNCYFKLGIIYNKIQDYEKSIFYYFESLKIKEQLKDEKGVAASLEEIGRIYMITPDADIDLPKARLNINKAIEIYEKLNDEIGINSSLTNLGAINLKEGINHQNENKIHVAIKLFKEALKKSEKLGLESSQASLLGNIGPSLRMLDEYDESLEYLFKSLKIKKKLMNYTGAAHSCNDISETYIDMNNLPKAKEYALKAIKFAKGVSINQERYAYYLLSEIEYNLGEYKNSFNDLKQYHKLADSFCLIFLDFQSFLPK